MAGTGTLARRSERRPDAEMVGSFKRFGEHGVAYEVIGKEGENQLRVRVVESGEMLSYPIADARLDPDA